jgi:hypothetical protein
MKGLNIKFYAILALIVIILLRVGENKGRYPQESKVSIVCNANLSGDVFKDKAKPNALPGKFGLIYHEQGHVKYLLKPVYDTIDRLDDNYFRIRLNDKFGLVYRNAVVVQPTYDSVTYFNKYLVSFYPHILFKNIKIFYYWIIFYSGALLLIILAVLFIRYGDLSNLFYISNSRKAMLQIYNITVKTAPLSICFVLFLPWAICLPYSVWTNTAIVFAALVLFDLMIKRRFDKSYNELRRHRWDAFVRAEEGLFDRKGLLFLDILYNNTGKKKYFLVKNLDGKWLIIDKRLRVYGDYKFDAFIEDKDGVFLMRRAKEEHYVYIGGEKSSVKRRVI